MASRTHKLHIERVTGRQATFEKGRWKWEKVLVRQKLMHGKVRRLFYVFDGGVKKLIATFVVGEDEKDSS